MKRTIAFFCLLAVVISCAQAPVGRKTIDNPDEYLYGSFVSENADTLNYRYIEPEYLFDGEEYPLVLFLHGAGERGNDNEKQLVHCSRVFTNPVNREKFPCYVIFPQCPEASFWSYRPERLKSYSTESFPEEFPQTEIMAGVMQLVEDFIKNNPVDRNRIYITGLSMGAMATYDTVIRYPDFFAAAVPICGAVNPDRISSDIKTPFRIYHGASDNVVPVTGSRNAYRALKSAGVPVTYTEFPGVEHGSWNAAYTDPELLPWMFSCKK